MTARFISFEGIDGAGKSTQIERLAQALRARGIVVEQTREPGGTPLGEGLREILLHQSMHLDTEALLMFAARREHLAQRIEPALAAGSWVLCDRFSDATYAYQVGGRGLAAARFAELERWVHPHLQPALSFLFDLAPEAAAQRMAASAREADRFEREQRDFFVKVRAAYLQRAHDCAERFVVIDAAAAPDTIAAEILRAVTTRFYA